MTDAELAQVIALHFAPERRTELIAVDHVDIEAGRGVVGDRYYGSRHRHISVQSATSLAQASAQWGKDLAAGDTRRTVTISAGEVPNAPGARLMLGTVLVEVVRVAAPCLLMDQINGEGARRALSGRAGSVCRVLTSGRLGIGDPVDLG